METNVDSGLHQTVVSFCVILILSQNIGFGQSKSKSKQPAVFTPEENVPISESTEREADITPTNPDTLNPETAKDGKYTLESEVSV